MDSLQQCVFIKPNGKQCRALAMTDNTHCYFHAPERASQRAASRRQGGRERAQSLRAATLPVTTPDAPLESVQDTVALLAVTINQTRRGELDPKVSNAVGYLASVLIRALEKSDLERRLEALEQKLQQQDLLAHKVATT